MFVVLKMVALVRLHHGKDEIVCAKCDFLSCVCYFNIQIQQQNQVQLERKIW
jgi:hypothetical protein